MVQNKWKKGNLEKAGSKNEEEGKERKMQQNISGKGNPGREHDKKENNYRMADKYCTYAGVLREVK